MSVSEPSEDEQCGEKQNTPQAEGKAHAKAPRPRRVCAVQETGRSLVRLECFLIALNYSNFANTCWPTYSSSNEKREDSHSDQKSLS